MDVVSSSYFMDVLYINKLIIFISSSIFKKFKSCYNINYVPFVNVGNGTWNKNPTQTNLFLWIGSKVLSMGNSWIWATQMVWMLCYYVANLIK
jgi:hypothetical protein